MAVKATIAERDALRLARELAKLRKAARALVQNALNPEDYKGRGTYTLRVTGRAIIDVLELTEED